jgi:hypothetical protein
MSFKTGWLVGVAALAVVGCGGKNEDVPRGREALQASPAAIWNTCDFEQGSVAAYLEPAFVAQSAELRIFAIHEATSTLGDAAGRARGEAAVHVDRGVRTVLVLSAHESTHWTVTADSGLEKVILDGRNAQSATVPAGVVVENLSGDDALAACGYADEDDCRTADLVLGAERLTGLSMTGFVGCRLGNEFGLHDDE